jgi:hypothetical protein
MNTNAHSNSQAQTEVDYNIVTLWTTIDVTRWIAGCIAGVIAACIAAVVAGAFASSGGFEFLFPVKLLGTALLGREATAYGSTSGLIAGVLVFGFITVFWGFVFGHFVRTNKFLSLLGMGVTWGLFSWVFVWNLFLHSVKAISASNMSSGPALAICLSYGLGMMSIAVVDKVIRPQPLQDRRNTQRA